MKRFLVAFFSAFVANQQKNTIRMLIENAPCRVDQNKLTFVRNQTAYLSDNCWPLCFWNPKELEHSFSGNTWFGGRCSIGNHTYSWSSYEPFPHKIRLCVRICN